MQNQYKLSCLFSCFIYFIGGLIPVVGNDELAQHAFIKSLEIEGSNVVAWCNLGMLYLKHDNPMLAHQIFYKAQSASPLHATSWIGQVLLEQVFFSTCSFYYIVDYISST